MFHMLYGLVYRKNVAGDEVCRIVKKIETVVIGRVRVQEDADILIKKKLMSIL